MKKIVLSLFISLFVLISNVHAHGPVRQKFVQSAVVNSSAKQVWDLIQDFGNMSWHPGVVETVETVGGNDKGATRLILLKSGGQISQELKKSSAKKMKLGYKTPTDDMQVMRTINFKGKDEPVRAFPLTGLVFSVVIKEIGADQSQIFWRTGYFRGYMNNLNPNELPPLMEAAASAAIQGYIRSGILGILKNFDSSATMAAIEECKEEKGKNQDEKVEIEEGDETKIRTIRKKCAFG